SPLAGVGEKLSGEIRGALGRGGGVKEQSTSWIQDRRGIQRDADVSEYADEEVIEIVGNAASQHAKAFELLGPKKLRLDLFALRDVYAEGNVGLLRFPGLGKEGAADENGDARAVFTDVLLFERRADAALAQFHVAANVGFGELRRSHTVPADETGGEIFTRIANDSEISVVGIEDAAVEIAES